VAPSIVVNAVHMDVQYAHYHGTTKTNFPRNWSSQLRIVRGSVRTFERPVKMASPRPPPRAPPHNSCYPIKISPKMSSIQTFCYPSKSHKHVLCWLVSISMNQNRASFETKENCAKLFICRSENDSISSKDCGRAND
jgi:hypothetical protein